MEETLVQALNADPTDPTAWLALADALEESGRPDRAEYLRLRHELMAAARFPGRAALEARLRALLLAGTPPAAVLWTVALNDTTSLTLALVPPGQLVMGSPAREPRRYNNEGPRHLVRVTRPYWLGVTPVTQAQFRALTGKNVSHFPGDDRPADSTDWPTAQDFCQRLGARLGRACRLPYEAEWEHACRAGTSTPYCSGRGTRAMRRVGWGSYDGQTGGAGETRPVAQFLPNPLGLYDMHGNVREWCQDDLRTYTAREQTDPRGRESSRNRVVRGGSWYYGPEDSRSASRYERPIDYRLNYYGFRVLVEAG
jgi:uncharacterized protein (TIGR02996 family)